MDNCIKCGALLNRGARFCAACGAAAESEETRVASPDPRGAANEETRLASEETRVAAARPWAGQQPPQPVRPLAPPNPPARRDYPEEAEQVIFTVRPTTTPGPRARSRPCATSPTRAATLTSCCGNSAAGASAAQAFIIGTAELTQRPRCLRTSKVLLRTKSTPDSTGVAPLD
ncbi:MAG: hypothetical protein LC802_06180 [Acidobacteria bacterium]|nr:hypothetical protein [Acidobacteriota bacterium]